MKKVLALALCVCMAAMLLAGCGGAGSSSAAASASGSAAAGTSASAAGALDPNIKATLTFATYDNEAMDLYEEMDLEGRFQELYPNVNIEIEEFKDDAEYFNQMKIRASAGELPDLMYLQTRYYPVFKDYMVDLSHTQAAANTGGSAVWARSSTSTWASIGEFHSINDRASTGSVSPISSACPPRSGSSAAYRGLRLCIGGSSCFTVNIIFPDDFVEIIQTI